MTKSQNTKNEQQKDLCITSEQLTEQWKKGELEEFYGKPFYIKKQSGVVKVDYLGKYGFVNNYDVQQVLAPVPSYDEWKESYNCMLENEVLRLKNAQLKELLKECRPYFNALVEKRLKLEYIPQVYELLTKIDEALR